MYQHYTKSSGKLGITLSILVGMLMLYVSLTWLPKASAAAPARLEQTSAGVLVYQVTSFTDNEVTLWREGSQIYIEDSADVIETVGDACENVSAHQVSCVGSEIEELHLFLGAGQDTLIINLEAGKPIPAGGLLYDGGDAGFDTLEIHGGNSETAIYDYYNAHDGRIQLDNDIIDYRGLEPIINSGTAANIIFNMTSLGDFIFLEDDGDPGNGLTRLRSGDGGFETTIFAQPTNSLTINGRDGSDSLNIDPAQINPIPTGGLFFNGDAGNDLLALLPATFTDVVYNFASATDGQIDLDGSTLDFTGIQPLFDNVTSTNRLFNYPNIPNTLLLTDSIFPNEVSSRLTSLNSSPIVEFRNPTGTLFIQGGDDVDKITIGDLEPNLDASLTVDGGDSFDTITSTLSLGNLSTLPPLSFLGGGVNNQPGDRFVLASSDSFDSFGLNLQANGLATVVINGQLAISVGEIEEVDNTLTFDTHLITATQQMRARVGLAHALVPDVPLYILDESLSGLPPEGNGGNGIRLEMAMPLDALRITGSASDDYLLFMLLPAGFDITLDGGPGNDTLAIDEEQVATILNFEQLLTLVEQFLPIILRN